MHHLFVSIPSARGIHPMTMWNVHNMRTVLEAAGHRLHGSSVYRMPLDLARNEMATAYLSTTADLNLLLDDDVQVEEAWMVKMIEAVDAGCEIVSAPCRLRDHSHGGAQPAAIFNVRPIGDVQERGGLRVDLCEMTGLGAVLVTRRVMERLHQTNTKYPSRLMPGHESADIFTSRVEPASSLVAGAPEDLSVYMLDDMVFSMKVRQLGFTIHAAIDVPTVHDGMAGCLGRESERLAKLQEKRAEARAKMSSIVGPDGKPVST